MFFASPLEPRANFGEASMPMGSGYLELLLRRPVSSVGKLQWPARIAAMYGLLFFPIVN